MVREIRRRKATNEPEYKLCEIVADISSIFWAGTDTQTTTLINSFNDLAENNNLQEDFNKLIQKWYGNDKGGIRTDISFDDINDNKQFTEFIDEAQRHAEIIPMGFFRKFSKDITISGYNFKKGDHWACGFQGINMNEASQPNPK